MMYKTSSPSHRPSVGVLADLIRKYGASSPEVQSYMDRFSNDEAFQKKAAPMMEAGLQIDALKKADKK